MSIQQIKATAAQQQLDAWGAVGIPLSDPPCQLRGVKKIVPKREDNETGVWECSPGSFRRQIAAGEVMHILAGRCSFTPDEGQPIEIHAGDTLFFPPNTNGVWDIQESVRKVYVLL